MTVEPLVGGDLVGAQHSAHVVVEDLGRRARQRGEAGVLQPMEVRGQVLSQPLRPFGDLERREPVHVHLGHGLLHRTGDVDVVVAVEVRMDAALQRDLGGAHLPRFHRALGDVVEGEQVRRAAQVQRQRALGEAAELALERAHVGVVDVAVVHPRDGVAHGTVPQFVGHLGHGHHLGPTSTEQRDDLVEAHLVARQHAVEHLADLAAHRTWCLWRTGRRQQHGRFLRGAGVPLGGSMSDEHHLGTVEHHVGGGDLLGPHSTGVVAAQALGVAAVEHREPQRGMQPTLRVADVLGVDGEPRGEREALPLGDLAETVECRPRPFGVDVVERQRRHAAPVVDAGVEQHAEVVAQVRRRLQVDLRRQQQTRRSDGPVILITRACGLVLHPGARLRQEVLHDHLLHVPVLEVRVANREQRIDAVLTRLAEPDQDAGGERDAQSARSVERRESPRRHLVGRTAMARQVVAQRLEHHPLAGRHLGQEAQLVLVERARVGVRQEAGLVEHQLRHRVQVVHRAVVALLAQPVAGHGVALLGTFSQGEQGFVATHASPVAGDAQHLFRREIGRPETSRRLSERAVPALVAAQHRQRDEHLRRIGDAGAVGQIAHGACLGHQFVDRPLGEFHFRTLPASEF